jgi:branched-chain amino acid transport system permease protein
VTTASRALRLLRRPEVAALIVAVVYPWVPVLDILFEAALGVSLRLDRQLVNIFIFAILALGLNLQVGYAGLLQLGIAAFFAIGAFSCGVLTVDKYPFQLGFWGALWVAPALAGVAGLVLGGPTMRLKGDYLAIVTLGFGEVVRVVLLNLENITDGSRGLNPLPAPWVPVALHDALQDAPGRGMQFTIMYYIALAILVLLLVGFRTVERTRLGRSFVALREDELASACMGISPAHTRLIAFAVGAAIAGCAGVLYATNLTTTAEPNTYDFNYSVMVLCAVIIGGLGSLRGVLLGSAVLLGFDNVLSPLITGLLQRITDNTGGNVLMTFSNWRWLIFGSVLVLMMRLRPEGLLPQSKIRAELHPSEESLV